MAYSIPSASTKCFQNASSYDKHRPSYPPEAVTSFLKHLKVHGVKRARLVDLAAGTGKFTELLVGRDEDFGDSCRETSQWYADWRAVYRPLSMYQGFSRAICTAHTSSQSTALFPTLIYK